MNQLCTAAGADFILAAVTAGGTKGKKLGAAIEIHGIIGARESDDMIASFIMRLGDAVAVIDKADCFDAAVLALHIHTETELDPAAAARRRIFYFVIDIGDPAVPGALKNSLKPEQKQGQNQHNKEKEDKAGVDILCRVNVIGGFAEDGGG